MDRHGKPADTLIHEADPFNAEPPRGALAGRPLTPIDRFYVRGHGPVPDQRSGEIIIDGLVEDPLNLSLPNLQDGRFEVVEITATLQCAGNRRTGLLQVNEIPGEAPWGPGATGTAVWRGVRLSDILTVAGVDAEAEHVAFIGTDVAQEAAPPQPYGASISLTKAQRSEVVLAWEMNGEPLPDVHGGPLRVIVPGFIGARSVKWVHRIEVRADPFDGYFQATAYRLLPAGTEPAPGVGVPLGEVALNADILSPEDGAEVRTGAVQLTGYAFAGGERSVVRVDVSTDGGHTWRQADLGEDLGRWAWRLWATELDLPAGAHEITVRAWDSAVATQPEHAASVWNTKGYVNNAWGRTQLIVR